MYVTDFSGFENTFKLIFDENIISTVIIVKRLLSVFYKQLNVRKSCFGHYL